MLNPEHYLDTIARKPHCVPYARNRVEHNWPAGYWELFKAMEEKYGPAQAGRDFIQILRCHVKYGGDTTCAAIAEARTLGVPSGDLVVSIIDRSRNTQIAPEPADLSSHPELRQYAVELSDLSRYQILIERGGINEQCIA